MRLLVLSDSHRHYPVLRKILLLHREADRIIFLGDGLNDLEEIDLPFPVSFIKVKGNNDYGSIDPYSETLTIENVRIYCTHGHLEHVKYGTELLETIAYDNNIGLVLYGHTHIQQHDYFNGLHLFNPGAVMDGNYGLVDIVNGQIMCIGANIYDR